jgi:hypothetical protein
MAKPLFQVGDLVRVQSNASLGPAEEALDAFSKASTLGRASGIYEVVRSLPEVDGLQQYRIKGGVPPQERVVGERQLIKASQQHAMGEWFRPTG